MISQSEIINRLDYDLTTGVFRWKKPSSNRAKVGAIAGYINDQGYRIIAIDGIDYRAHRLAHLIVYGSWPDHSIDHINCDPSDNRIANLRQATTTENLGNTRTPKHNKSGVKGVYWDNSRQKWHAQISVCNRSKSLGRFLDIRDAAAAYEVAARQHFGDFARLG